MEGPALIAEGAVTGDDIRRGPLENGSLLAGDEGLSRLLAVGVVKAQAAAVIHRDGVDLRQGAVELIQSVADGSAGIALSEHIPHLVHRGDEGRRAADDGVDALPLAADVQIQGHHQGDGGDQCGHGQETEEQLPLQGILPELFHGCRLPSVNSIYPIIFPFEKQDTREDVQRRPALKKAGRPE